VRVPFGAEDVELSAVTMAMLLCAPVFAFKQMTNVLQMLIAFDKINAIDLERTRQKGA